MSTSTPNRLFTDFSLTFNKHPVTADIINVSNDNAIKQSIKNLIMSQFYDKPFRPHIGTNIQKLLFELYTPIVGNAIKKEIIDVVTNWEPRANILQVEIEEDINRHGLEINITFAMSNSIEPVEVSIFLERIR